MSTEESLRALILQLSSLRYFRLKFSTVLEQKFTSEATTSRLMRQWLEGLISIWLYCCFAALNAFLGSSRVKHDAVLRFGLVVRWLSL